MEELIRLACVRPLVRYVDQEQAVIETHVTLAHATAGHPADQEGNIKPPGNRQAANPLRTPPHHIELQIELRGPDGSSTQHLATVPIDECHGMTRFELSTPHRWWPAGMGEQPLYLFTVTLLVHGEPADLFETTLGMTSVRPAHRSQLLPTLCRDSDTLLINGRVCDIRSVVPVMPNDEGHILPAGGHSILLIRDHFGPDVLFEAADRAGILLVQSLPLRDALDENAIARVVDRLASHPSLAGWLIDRVDNLAADVVTRLRTLDPTRCVFLQS